MKVFRDGKAVTLTPEKLLASGGEGTVYGDGTWCYKVFHDAGRAARLGDKIRELAVLDRPEIVRPEHLLTDPSGGPVGYAMRRVKSHQDLPPLFTRSYRDRKRVSADTVFGLVLKARDLVAFTHARGVLVVDLNELNFLASAKLDALWAIDVDSWQTPSFPATALMETVRDRHAPQVAGRWVWSVGTDWFSFAVLATQLLVGVHPYRGRHPDCHPTDPAARLEARMARNLSVFNPQTVLPPPCFPLAAVPPAYRAWLTAVLERGERSPAPASGVAPVAVPVAVPAPVAPAAVAAHSGLTFRPVMVTPAARIVAVRAAPSALYALAADGRIYGQNHHDSPGASYMAQVPAGEDHDLALLPSGQVLVVYRDPGTGEAVCGLPDGTELDRRPGRPVVTPDGRVTVLAGDTVSELTWVGAVRARAGAQVVARVLEGTAALYPGVAVQRLLDAWYATVFAGGGRAYQVRLAELGVRRVIDARYDAGVLVVVAVDPGTGSYDTLTYRFDADHTARDVREERDGGYAGVALVTTPKGVAIQIDAAGTVRGFRARPGDAFLTQWPGSRLDASTPTGRRGDEVLVADGGTVYHLSAT